MLLTFARLEELRAEVFADDVEITSEMRAWAEADVVAYLESGGMISPAVKPDAPPPAPDPRMLQWSSGPCTEPVVAAARPAAHADRVSNVRLFTNPDGSMLAVTAGMDCCVRLWDLAARGSFPPRLISTMGSMGEGTSWAYDAVGLGAIDARTSFGIASGHSGGMTGEPPKIVKLWSATAPRQDEGDGSAPAAAIGVLACQPQDGLAATEVADRRGVHCVDYNDASRTLVTVSEDGIGVWRCGGSYASPKALSDFRLVHKGPHPLLGTPSHTQRILSDGVTLAMAGRLTDGQSGRVPPGIPLVDLGRGGLSVTRLTGCTATDSSGICELGPHAIAASTNSRIWIWDRRDASAPSARLELRDTLAMSSLLDATGVPVVLISNERSGGVQAFDLRSIPNDKKAKAPQPVATLLLSSGERSAAGRVTALDADGAAVVAVDSAGSLHAWDVGRPLTATTVAEVVGNEASQLDGLADLAQGALAVN